MKTISRIIQAITFMCFILRRAAERPYTMKAARTNLWVWACVTGCAFLSLASSIVLRFMDGDWWSWWHPFNGTIFLLDIVMLRASTVGYFYRKTKDTEIKEFERIIANF